MSDRLDDRVGLWPVARAYVQGASSRGAGEL